MICSLYCCLFVPLTWSCFISTHLVCGAWRMQHCADQAVVTTSPPFHNELTPFQVSFAEFAYLALSSRTGHSTIL